MANRRAVDNKKEFAALLSLRGQRITPQRQLIAEEFFKLQDHAPAEELYHRVSQVDPSVSRATVYRTLRVLQDLGQARAHQFGSGGSRFEPEQPERHHDHLICTNCGRILEFANPRIEQLQTEVADAHRFQVVDHKMEIYGLCRDCRPTETRTGGTRRRSGRATAKPAQTKSQSKSKGRS